MFSGARIEFLKVFLRVESSCNSSLVCSVRRIREKGKETEGKREKEINGRHLQK